MRRDAAVDRAAVGDAPQPAWAGLGQLTPSAFDVQCKECIKGALILQRQARKSYDRGLGLALCLKHPCLTKALMTSRR